MKQKIISLIQMSEELANPEICLEMLTKVKEEVRLAIEPLRPFGIHPIGNIEAAQSNFNIIQGENFYCFRAYQRVEGHWLNFLHTRRANIIPKLEGGKLCGLGRKHL